MTIICMYYHNFGATIAVIVAGGGGSIVNVSRETVSTSCGLGTLNLGAPRVKLEDIVYNQSQR